MLFLLFKHVTHNPKASRWSFVLCVASLLIEQGIEAAEGSRTVSRRSGRRSKKSNPLRLEYKKSGHWPSFIEPAAEVKKMNPTKVCAVCKPSNLAKRFEAGDRCIRPRSQYVCVPCNISLHIQCFKAYHIMKYYPQT